MTDEQIRQITFNLAKTLRNWILITLSILSIGSFIGASYMTWVIGNRFDIIELRLDNLEKRMDRMESKLDKLLEVQGRYK